MGRRAALRKPIDAMPRDNMDVRAMKSLLKYKIQRIEELEQQIEHLQSALDKEKIKSHEKLEQERTRFNRSLDFLKSQIDLKDKRMDMLLEAIFVNGKYKIVEE